MAGQIRNAMIQFSTEYGYFPTNGLNSQGIGDTGANIAFLLTGDISGTNDNPRRIAFLEVPMEFTTNRLGNITNGGIMTPSGLYTKGSLKGKQSKFSYAVDHDYDGKVWVTNGVSPTNISGSCHVWIKDPRDPDKATAGTWK